MFCRQLTQNYVESSSIKLDVFYVLHYIQIFDIYSSYLTRIKSNMKCILNHFVQAGLVQVADCDEILSEFTKFLIYSCSVSKFTSFSVFDRSDTVYFDLMSSSHRQARSQDYATGSGGGAPSR